MLVLVALSMLTVLYPLNTQDATRFGLTQSVLEYGTINVDRYHTLMSDRSYRDGHWYSDKAPGMSFLALPAVAVFHLGDVVRGKSPSLPIWLREGQLWALRVLTSGLGLLLATFLIGRVAEGLRPGYGAPVAVSFALATIAGPLGAIEMEHDVSAALGFAAFLVAARGRRATVFAGALAGTVVLFDYTGAILAAVIACYVLWRYGLRPLLAFVAGSIPAAVLLGLYDLAAFGSPFHLSYAYVTNQFTAQQKTGLFGIAVPTVHGLWLALGSDRGLLVVSPVVLAALAGLVSLARRGPRVEALVCLVVPAFYLVLDAGYFDPYGGASPGPRFFAPALPFLALGLVEAYGRWPRVTAVLALVSVAIVSLDTFTWQGIDTSQPLAVPTTIWSRLGTGRWVGIVLEVAAIVAATLYAGRRLVSARALTTRDA